MNGEGELEQIAASFVVPQKSGVYLTKSDIISLARASEASLRINERRRMLTDVLRSPQTLDELEALLDRLIAFCSQSAASYQEMVDAYPTSAAVLEPWRAKAQKTVEKLTEIKEELRL